MSELSKDPAIKLFGRTIPLHDTQLNNNSCSSTELKLPGTDAEKVSAKQTKDTETKPSNSDSPNNISELSDPTVPVHSISTTKTDHVKEEEQSSKNTVNHASKPPDPNSQELKPDQEKTLKKPDKILPCPRCNSMDTKFCYYNNYNVNQPRHFCKNCQRYWTAGGTMRNVPVGAGRRKNKHPNIHNRHILMASDALLHHQLVGAAETAVATTGAGAGTGPITVLKFGTEVPPLCESMTAALKIEEERKVIDLVTDEQPPCASSVGAEKNRVPASAVPNEKNGFPPVPCYPTPAIVYPWGPAIPLPFVPASFFAWPGGPGPWSMPWTAFPNPSSPLSNSNNSSSSGNGSPTLGKHSREPASHSDEPLEKIEKRNLWAPKTLRIVDPDEAAKSSIWATLGIKHDDKSSIFKSFGAKDQRGNCQVTDPGPVLHANPAALSRSRSFQERT